MKNLVLLEKDDPVTTSLIIAEETKNGHRGVIQLIKIHQENLESFGTLQFQLRKSAGRPTEYALLNEMQTTFLIALMKNNETVVRFKKELVRQFYTMRKTLTQITIRQNNAEWQQLREIGKATRKEETETVKQFIEYATKSGSKNAQTYYPSISRMENKALFFLEQKFDNVRDILAGQQLAVISSADQIVEKTLKEGMEQGMEYHEIFQLAKKNVETFANIVGKTPAPMTTVKALQNVN